MEKTRETGRPNLVQELSEAGRDPPPNYVLRAENRPVPATSAPSPPAAPVPAVNLRRLSGPDGESEHELAKLRSDLQSWGLFQVVGHEISASFLDQVRDAAKTFFHLPLEAKQIYKCSADVKAFEGYGTDPITVEGQTLDWCDRLYLLVQPEKERTIDLWPENPSSFRGILHDYSAKVKKIAEVVLTILAKTLKLNEDYFSKISQDEHRTFARFNYYPACSRPDHVFGIKPHSDGTLVTILLPDKDVGGLQVLKNGEWIMVSQDPHALLIILGDEMEIISNGIYHSAVHRVITNSEKERISLAMFHALSPETELEPAEELVNEMRPRSYRKVRMKDYVEVFMQRFLEGKRAIDWVKI